MIGFIYIPDLFLYFPRASPLAIDSAPFRAFIIPEGYILYDIPPDIDSAPFRAFIIPEGYILYDI
ncbi:MAG: hypothetical protein QM564_02970, partial [Bergeyella sp.]